MEKFLLFMLRLIRRCELEMKMKRDEYRFNYVPSYIVRAWSGDGRSVRYNTAYEDEIFSSPVEDMYVEALKVTGDLNPDVMPMLTLPSVVNTVTRLSCGDKRAYEEGFFDVLLLIMEEYFSNPRSYGRFTGIMSEEVGKRKKAGDSAPNAEELSKEAVRKMDRERTTQELVVELNKGFMYAAYILDLMPVLVEADDEMGFLLSSCPLLFGNPYNRAAFNDLGFPFARKGAVFFMPISPKRAVCLYDSDVYFVNEKNGRISLSLEDTLLLAGYAINVSDNIIFRPDREDYYRAFKERNFQGFYDVSSFNPSFLRMKRGVPSGKNEIRKLPSAMMDYDERHSSSVIENYEDFINKRLGYALSLVTGKRRSF